MERRSDSLRELKGKLVAMGKTVERAISNAIEGLEEGNQKKFDLVYESEIKINKVHVEIEDTCIRLLSLKRPLTAQLKLIVAALKINADLERIADQAVNVAHNSEKYLDRLPFKTLIDLPVMFREVKVMVSEAIEAYVRSNQEHARKVLKRNHKVDALKNKVFHDVQERLKTKPERAEQGIYLVLIARGLERMGDYAANIAEDIIFAITGEDVRHSVRPESVKKSLKK